MKKPDTKVFLYSKTPNKDGLCLVQIRVYYNRKYRFYSTGVKVRNQTELDQILGGKRRTENQKHQAFQINHLKNKADTIIKEMGIFSFDAFDERFIENKNVTSDVFFAFDRYIEELKTDNSIGTATVYKCARASLAKFKPGLTFADVTVKFLKRYEKWMRENGNSNATIGMYLRNLRTIYNQQNLDRSIYPFGKGKNKYSIPTGRNIKKALTVEEIAQIFHYEARPGTNEEMARDYWMFLYLCNGMNVKDFCLLKWENIDGEVLTYNRAKTQQNNRRQKPIHVALKPQTLQIINKWGVRTLSKEDYIFPHFVQGMDAEKQRKVHQQLTKVINKHIKRIAKALGINKDITTYYARHSFATVLKRSGANISMISDLLGHSSLQVTENYLDGFEKEQIQKQTDVLTVGFEKAN